MCEYISGVLESLEQLVKICYIEEVRIRCYELRSILSSKDVIEFGLIKPPSVKPVDDLSKELSRGIYKSLLGVRKHKDVYVLDSYIGYFKSISR